MARTIRNSARDPHKRNTVKRDAISVERRQSKRTNWIGPCDTVTLCDGVVDHSDDYGSPDGWIDNEFPVIIPGFGKTVFPGDL